MPRTPRRLPRILLAVASVLVMVLTVVAAGANALMGHLAGNITAVDVSSATGGTAAPTQPLAQVNETTGTYQPLNMVLIGSDSRSGAGNATANQRAPTKKRREHIARI